jgi:c-di-GMP-related signal transduction protein
VLEGLPIDASARTVLLEDAGPLSPVFDLMLAVEAGVWPRIAALATQLGIDQEFLAQSQWSAMEWAHSIVTAP